jgi:PIN domain nuclease of toxin-antitoxin system
MILLDTHIWIRWIESDTDSVADRCFQNDRPWRAGERIRNIVLGGVVFS